MKLRETNDDIYAWITVLYGHNMKNGSMFGCLHDYKEADFFRQNSEILVYTETQCLKYEIVAAAEFSDLYLTDYYGVDDENGRNAFLSELKQNAAGQTGSRLKDTWADENMPGDSERYLILSTCVDGHDELRYLVTGRLVEEITW